MGFLDKLFGKDKKKEVKAKELKLAEATSYLDKKTEGRFNDLEKQVFSKFAEVKHILNEIRAELDEFRKRDLLAEEGNKRLRMIVSTSQKNLIGQMESMIKKLTPPKERDFETLKDYCMNSSDLLQKEINFFGKNIAYTGILLKQEIKTLGEYIRELNKIFLQLKELFEKNPLLKIPELKQDINLLSSFATELDELKNSIPGAKEQLNKSIEEKNNLLNELNKLKNSSDSKQLHSLQDEKNNLIEQRENLLNESIGLFGKIDKPLKRFLKAVESKHYLIEQKEERLLRNYLDKPLYAIKQDQKGEALKKILLEVKRAIGDGKVSLKEKEKQKKLDAIDELLQFNFFDNIYWNLNKIESGIMAVEKRIEPLRISKEIASVETKIAALEKEIEERGNRTILLKEKEQKKKGEAILLKEKIENLLYEIIIEKIDIKID